MPRTLVPLLTVALLATLVSGQTQPATQPAIDPSLAQARFPWLIVHHTAHGYRLTMTVNGKPYGTWTATGVDKQRTPLVAGKNTLTVDLVRTDPSPAHGSAIARIAIEAAPQSEPTDEQPVVELAAMEVAEHDQGSGGRLTLTVDFVNEQPRAFTMQQVAWRDADQKRRSWEYTADGDLLAAAYAHEKESQWRTDGKLARTVTHTDGRIVDAVAYKPDGSVGAEVKAGHGDDAFFDDQGRLEQTCPVKDGRRHGEAVTYADKTVIHRMTYDRGVASGPARRYDSKGVLRVTGQYKDDAPDGTWQRLGDDGKVIAESEYKAGELIKGVDLNEIDLH